MRGDQIGALSIGNAYNRSVTLTFSNSSNQGMFSTLKSYFAAGNRVLIIYVPRTRGTYSGGYCYDYLSIVRHCKMKNFSCGYTLKRKYFLVYLKQI